MQSNVNTAPRKPHYVYNQQRNICMNNTFLIPKKPIHYQRYSFEKNWMNESRSLTPPPLPPKPFALIQRNASAPSFIDVDEYWASVRKNARR